MYTYKNLENVTDSQIADCLNLAFSDYAIPIHLSEEQLRTIFNTTGVDKKLSFGAFYGNDMVGFILNSCGVFKGKKCLFDAGTGVVPAHRGKKVFTSLFGYAQQYIKQYGITKYYLEVLQNNDRVLSLYKKLGFSVVREFSVLNAQKAEESSCCNKVRFTDFNSFCFEKAIDCTCIEPSFEHCTHILKLNPDQYSVAYTQDKELTAFCVFSNEGGKILQLGYKDICDLKLIIKSILSRHGNVTAKNIDMSATQVIAMLKSIGFIQVAEQYEMVKDIIQE